MKSIYRLISAVLVGTALTALATSCGQTETSGNSGSDDTSAISEIMETAPETAYLEKFSVYDFEGASFPIIAQHVPNEQPTVPDSEETGEIVLDALYNRDKTIEENYNIDIVYTNEKYNEVSSRGELNKDLKASIQAGDCEWNFVITSIADGINSLITGGFLQDMLSVENLCLENPWWSQNLYKIMNYQGKMLTTTGPISLAYYYSPCVLAYNQRLAANYGIEDLYSVVVNGSWTLDYFANIIKDRAEDINGDGKMNEDDFYSVASDELSAAAFFIGVDGKQDSVSSDGTPYFVIGEDINVTKIGRIAELIGNKETVLRTESVSGGESIAIKKTKHFENGQALFLAYNMNGLIACLRDMADDYGIIPNPKWDESQEEYKTYGSAFGPVGVALPVTNNNLEMTGVVMESMAYLSYSDVGTLMFNVTLKEKVARDSASKETLEIIYKDVIYDWTGIFSIGGLNTLVRDICIGKKENIASEWAKIQNVAESKLQEILDAYAGVTE